MSHRLTLVKAKKFGRFAEYMGCVFKRQKGSHLIYDRPDLKRPVVFPADEVPPEVIKSNLRTLKVETKEYLEIMAKL